MLELNFGTLYAQGKIKKSPPHLHSEVKAIRYADSAHNEG